MVSALAIFIIIIAKFKPVYEVKIGDKNLGLVTNQAEFTQRMEDSLILTGETVAVCELEQEPKFELKFVTHETETNEEEVLEKLEDSLKVIYKIYAITLKGEVTEYVDTLEEAETLVASLKDQYQEDILEQVGITEIYTESKDNRTTEYMLAKVTTGDLVQRNIEAEETRQRHTFDGVYFSAKPVTGRISSRFGAVESIRDHVHKGIDVAAPNGTPIYAAADGIVKFSGMNNGGYGNLVIISHGNGIETYYGHCSKLYVKAGQTIEAGDKIAAVGSTGHSTGNHLHFEIRKNGSQINPQRYVFN